MTKRIQRRRTKGWRKPEGAVYVGRGTKMDTKKPGTRQPPSEGTRTKTYLYRQPSYGSRRTDTHHDDAPAPHDPKYYCGVGV